MTQQRRTHTRNQMKRERMKTALSAAALMIMWAVLMMASLKTWADHPAEQPISGTEYLESIQSGGDFYGNP